MKKEPNWYPGIQKQQPFARGVELDNPRHMTRKREKRASGNASQSDQMALPMDVGYLEPILCPECFGMGREKKGRVCRACGGEGVIPANPNCQETCNDPREVG